MFYEPAKTACRLGVKAAYLATLRESKQRIWRFELANLTDYVPPSRLSAQQEELLFRASKGKP